ncbi:MAG: DUF2207 domain-containing protein [Clostridia bacterium]|nr:DUF2207 domain-containing protein [Clostridia bacterium]
MKKLVVIILSVIVFLSFSQQVFAYNDYYIKNYVVNITVNEDSTYDVQEIIDVFFSVDRHGIYRTIPTSYSNQRAIISNVSINDQYSTSKTMKETTYKIGNAETFVRGDKQYVISYTYDIGDDNIPEFDQFYYNIIGPNWDTQIENVKFNITFPKDFDENKIWLSKGDYGSTASDQSGFKKIGYKIEGYSADLGPYEGLTIKVEFPEGYFIGERNNADASRNGAIIGWILCLGLIILLYLLWVKHGKDDKLYPTVQFQAPEGMTSAEVGYVVDGIVDNKDITSLIIYWADKGFLKIEELKKNKFRFTKIMIPVDGKKYEEKMFTSFFALGNGQEVTTDDLEQRFYSELPSLKQLVKWEYKGKKLLFSKKADRIAAASLLSVVIPIAIQVYVILSGFSGMEFVIATLFASVFSISLGAVFKQFIKKWHVMTKTARASRIIFVAFALGIMALVTFLILFIVRDSFYQSIWSISFVISETIRTVLTLSAVFLLSGLMEKRTDYGKEILEKLLGLKEFIETAEMDKLKLMSKENPEYFYNILPYAMVLGLDRTWAKKFESLTIEPPNWYQGAYGRAFSSMIFYSHFNSFVAKTSTSMQMPKSSGSSMGGGGFSGGGVGGGGGGSW